MCPCHCSPPLARLLALSAYAERMKVFSITSSNSLPDATSCSPRLDVDTTLSSALVRVASAFKLVSNVLRRGAPSQSKPPTCRAQRGSVDVGWAERADVTSAWNEHDEGDSKTKDEANRKNEERESRVLECNSYLYLYLYLCIRVSVCARACASVRACAACERDDCACLCVVCV